MPPTDPKYNPAYSTIKAIYLANESGSESLNIARQNTECQFERIEFVENVNDVFPNGVLVVRDTKDIASRIRRFLITKIKIEFFNSEIWNLDITSVSYLNNAASDNEENFVGIYFSNKYYKMSQTSTLYDKLYSLYPNVLRIHNLVDTIKRDYFGIEVNDEGVLEASGFSDETKNYALYRPMNTIYGRDEDLSDNGVEYLNYLAHGAIDKQTGDPNFMFWTEFNGSINFKAFKYNLEDDESFSTIGRDFRRFAIYEGDAVLQRISRNNTDLYRKIYFFNTNPAYQYISKNYYYIRKTPKVLDEIPAGLCGSTANSLVSELDSYMYSSLAYQFQDEGERYNIEIISQGLSGGKYYIIPGSNQLNYDRHWGYYDGTDPIDSDTPTSHISKQFGTQKNYKDFTLAGGFSGYMNYVDNTEMWKNYFDLTPIHPNYPDGGDIPGNETKLQKIINARYSAFSEGLSGALAELEKIRKIELQNFISYSLCCMGQEDCFFALLQRYEVDSTKGPIGGHNMYRYKWNKIEFPFGSTGSSGSSGGSGYFHHLEKWELGGYKSGVTQDETWAINLNERGMSADYLPPGWVVSSLPSGFNYRPIGAKGSSIGSSGDIHHIAKICRYDENGKYFYYFIAENIVDGTCQ
jgi:hypothetical protein